MKKINLLIIICLMLIGLAFPVMAINSTVQIPQMPTIDVVNSSGMQSWVYYLMVENATGLYWEFPVIGFAAGLMDVFDNAFSGLGSGNLIYLILWGLFIMMVWRQSGKITIPAMIACITAGAWSLLFPESAQPWVLILLAAALASQLMTFYAKE